MTAVWPSSREFVEAVQNPRTAFVNPELRDCQPALDRFGIPLVASGNFAYAFKLRDNGSGEATGVRCFRGFIPDRDKRYSLIDRHLDAHPNTSLASFDFEPEGIVVAGHKYPIVLMEWIEGPTLELYLEQVLTKKEVLQHLADDWLRVIEGLSKSQIAHGDLQHGNIIIDKSQFRLIDFDGMYVPAMQNWRSNELGHPHYQHPKRDPSDFGLNLDNFSSLVIYLSFISLAVEPELWKKYHDENLIFSKTDFTNPANSVLFSCVRKLGQQHKDLILVLEKTLKGKPQDAPFLLDLVSRKSKLPSWMVAPADVRIEVKTREARPGEISAAPQIPDTNLSPSQMRWWQQVTSPATLPQPVQAKQPLQAPYVPDWKKIHRTAWSNALKFGFIGLFLFWIWVPLFSEIGRSIGLAKDDISTFVFWVYVSSCIIISYIATIYKERQPSQQVVSPPIPQTPRPIYQAPPVLPTRRPTWQPTLPTQQRQAPAGHVVGSKIRSIYHDPNCEWALKMSHRNRVTFNSSREAKSRGYRPCKVCRP